MTDKRLYLADLAGKVEDEIKSHIADKYAGKDSGFDYGNPTPEEKAQLLENLKQFDVLVAYEHVGSWGCDSSSYFLLRRQSDDALLEVRGSHCSCYGFEGQWDMEPVESAYLNSEQFYVGTGGYDDSAKENEAAIRAFVRGI